MVEGRVCQRRSKTWTGFCGNTRGCDSQCKRWERASHGACHAQFPGFACFCYFNCWSKQKVLWIFFKCHGVVFFYSLANHVRSPYDKTIMFTLGPNKIPFVPGVTTTCLLSSEVVIKTIIRGCLAVLFIYISRAITCLIELEQLTYTSDCYSFMITISILELTNYPVTIKVTG